MDEMTITKRMLSKLREGKDEQARKAAEIFVKEEKENDNFVNQARILMDEAINKKKALTEENNEDNYGDSFEITEKTPQFGDVRTTQEDAIRKTINDNIQFESLKYYPKADDMTLDGKLPQMGLSFQFRFAEPSGDGCFIFCDGFQLTETNARLIGKIRDAYMNWKNSIINDNDLMEKLKKTTENNE